MTDERVAKDSWLMRSLRDADERFNALPLAIRSRCRALTKDQTDG